MTNKNFVLELGEAVIVIVVDYLLLTLSFKVIKKDKKNQAGADLK
jgi:hypothetical protein